MHYRFSTLFVLACTSLLLMVAGCDQSAMKSPTDTEENTSEVTPTEQEKKVNAALDAMAQDVAAALRNRSVRTLIKKETGKLLAGQHNVLFQTIATKKVQGMAKDGEPMTFQQVLAQQRASLAKNEGLSKSKAVAQVEEDAAMIPKFDIGVPVHHKKWNPTKTTPLVAFHHRQEIDDTELERVKAYDAEGNVHWLDAQEAPEQPVVVVGINERTTESGEVRSGYTSGKKGKSNTTRIGCPVPLAKCIGGGGGDGGSSGEDPREYGDEEVLERIKVLDEKDNWFQEGPEVRIRVRSINKTGSDERRGRDYNEEAGKVPSVDDEEEWYSPWQPVFHWDENVGSHTIWFFFEHDSSCDVSWCCGGCDAEKKIVFRGNTYIFEKAYNDDSDDLGWDGVAFDTPDDKHQYGDDDVRFEVESRDP